MKIVFLDRASVGDASLKALEEMGELVCYDRTAPNERAERIADAEIIITNKVRIDRPEMEAAPHLKMICIAATGMNNVDLEAAEERGIAVKNVAGYSTESVVQSTFAQSSSLNALFICFPIVLTSLSNNSANWWRFSQTVSSSTRTSRRITSSGWNTTISPFSIYSTLISSQISNTQSFASSPKERFCFFFNKVFLNF